MNFLHMFWPATAHSAQLRDLAEKSQSAHGARRSMARKNADFEADIGTLSMVCVSIVATLIQKGIVTEAEFQEAMATVDEFDSKPDLALDPNAMRKALGLPPLQRRGLASKAAGAKAANKPVRKPAAKPRTRRGG